MIENDLVEFVNSIYVSKVGPIASTIREKKVMPSGKKESQSILIVDTQTRLIEAKKLFEKDLISKGEYEAMRKKILGLAE